MLRFVINLDRSPERWKIMNRKLEAIGIKAERISAVDGKTLSESTLKTILSPLDDISKINCPRALLPNEVGCFLSHKKCWQILSEDENENWALIMEDDIELSPRIRQYISNTDWIPKEVNLLQLHLWGKKWDSKVGRNSYKLPNGDEILLPLHPPALGTQAYLISKVAARDAIALSNQISAPVDNFLSGIFSKFAKKHPTYKLDPAVVTTTDMPSSIDAKAIIKSLPYLSKIKNHPLRRLLKIKHQVLYTLFAKNKTLTFK